MVADALGDEQEVRHVDEGGRRRQRQAVGRRQDPPVHVEPGDRRHLGLGPDDQRRPTGDEGGHPLGAALGGQDRADRVRRAQQRLDPQHPLDHEEVTAPLDLPPGDGIVERPVVLEGVAHRSILVHWSTDPGAG